MSTEDCPNFGTHRYYMAGKSYTDFVPYEGDFGRDTPLLYQRNEYAVLSCQCGAVQRTLVKEAR